MRQLMPPRHHKDLKPAPAYIFDDPDRSGKCGGQALREFRNQRTDLLVVYLRKIGLKNLNANMRKHLLQIENYSILSMSHPPQLLSMN